MELIIELGCGELKTLQVSGNASYTLAEIIQELFITAISQIIEEDITWEVMESEAYVLMVDESREN